MAELDLNGKIYWSCNRELACDVAKLAEIASRDLPSLLELDQDGVGAMHIAARYGASPALLLILKLGADPRQKSSEGYTPLMMAAGRGHAELAHQILMAAGPGSRSDEDADGRTALEWAIGQSRGACAAMLLPEAGEPLVASDGRALSDLAQERGLSEVALELRLRERSESERLALQAQGAQASLPAKPPRRV